MVLRPNQTYSDGNDARVPIQLQIARKTRGGGPMNRTIMKNMLTVVVMTIMMMTMMNSETNPILNHKM